MDLYACIGVPVIVSMPHFLNGDPALLGNIESGLNPVKEMHQIYVDMELVRTNPTTNSFFYINS